jgi:TetR/AcrR family transcriptional regulator, cholesterol catabolism regulator
MAVRAPLAEGPTRRDQILAVAARLFSERGYHATSMRDIGEATGILAGSLYSHIRGKEDLLFGIVQRAAEAFLSGLEAVLATDAPAEEKLRLAMRAHVDVVAGDPEAARVFHHEWRALTGRGRTDVRKLRRRYESMWDGIVRDLPGAIDPRAARLLVLSAANWTYTWYRPDGPMSPQQVADRFTDLLLDGLGGGE